MPAGVVATFDEGRGLGTIRGEGAEYSFHCTQLADGSRSVRVGQAVTFAVVPGRLGNWEAASIQKVDGA
jgi:cold shock CspA family protein